MESILAASNNIGSNAYDEIETALILSDTLKREVSRIINNLLWLQEPYS